MSLPSTDVAVVGGGAAGLATAIFAARDTPGALLCVLDGARTLGAKILISGGGRCNLTNREVTPRDFNGGEARLVTTVLRALPVPDTLDFFAGLGVSLHEERWGKLFPDSNRARTVLDALVAEAAARGVTFKIGVRVQALARAPGGFRLETTGGTLEARAVVLATGGRSLPRTGSDGHGYVLAQRLGHSLVPTTPALVPLLLDGGDLHEGLAGVAVDVALALTAPGARRRIFEGPLLWTHHGISGPAVLDASRHLLRHRLEGRAPQLAARLVPGDFERVEAWLLGASRARPRANVATVLAEQVPVTLAARIAGRVGAEAHTLATLPRDVRRAVVHGLVALPLAVRDSRGYDHAEVTAGGIALAEIDPATMQSRLCPGLFLVGEILDVDGRLGGFNFQWAWASARAAANGLRRFGSG